MLNPIARHLDRMLDERDEHGVTVAERIADKLVECSLAGDLTRQLPQTLDLCTDCSALFADFLRSGHQANHAGPGGIAGLAVEEQRGINAVAFPYPVTVFRLPTGADRA